MSSPVTKALYDLLAGDAALAGQLSAYKAGPAIFTARPAPADAAMPYVTVSGPVTTVSRPVLDNRARGPREEVRDVTVWAPATGSGALVDAVGDRLEALLDGAALAIEGMPDAKCQAEPAIEVPSDTDAYGRLVQVKVKWQRG